MQTLLAEYYLEFQGGNDLQSVAKKAQYVHTYRNKLKIKCEANELTRVISVDPLVLTKESASSSTRTTAVRT